MISLFNVSKIKLFIGHSARISLKRHQKMYEDVMTKINNVTLLVLMSICTPLASMKNTISPIERKSLRTNTTYKQLLNLYEAGLITRVVDLPISFIFIYKEFIEPQLSWKRHKISWHDRRTNFATAALYYIDKKKNINKKKVMLNVPFLIQSAAKNSDFYFLDFFLKDCNACANNIRMSEIIRDINCARLLIEYKCCSSINSFRFEEFSYFADMSLDLIRYLIQEGVTFKHSDNSIFDKIQDSHYFDDPHYFLGVLKLIFDQKPRLFRSGFIFLRDLNNPPESISTYLVCMKQPRLVDSFLNYLANKKQLDLQKDFEQYDIHLKYLKK